MGAGCTAPNCTNSSSKGFVMFRYPRDEILKKKWLDVIGRPTWHPYREARLCENHFTPVQWSKTTNRLVEGAVPISKPLNRCTCDPAPENRSPRKMRVFHDHGYASSVSPYCKLHGKGLTQAEVKEALVKNCEAKKRLHELEKLEKLQKEQENKENTPRKKKYTTGDIRKGLQLRFACGSAGYKKVLQVVNNIPNNENKLPSIRELQRSIEHIFFAPGILKEIIEPLKLKFNSFLNESDKDVNIVFDDLVLKKKVEWDASLKKNMGYGTLPGDEKKFAEKGELYLFRGTHKNFKQIIGYLLNPPTINVPEKKKFVIQLLEMAKYVGANVISLVCDMGNRGLLSALGFNTQKGSLKWCIPNPVKPDAKLWACADPVHVFKSAKETFCKEKYLELPALVVAMHSLPSAVVKVEHIEWLALFQQNDSLSMVPGLTLKHIHTSHFSKMKVGNAIKVLNPKTSAALSYLSVKGIVSEEYETTAFFLKLMNRWFQLMSSRSLVFALGYHNMEAYNEAIEHLQLVIFVFRHLKFPGGWKPVQSHVIFTTSAVLEIQEHLLKERGYSFVQTGNFTSDCVENCNSCIRMNTKNPSALELKTRLKQMCVSQFNMKISSSSYDFDDCPDFVDLLLSNKPSRSDGVSNVNVLTNAIFRWQSSVPREFFKPHQDDVLYRVCGYLIISLKKRNILKCTQCLKILEHLEQIDSPHPNSLYVILTDFVPGTQMYVSDEVFQLLRLVECNIQMWKSQLQETVADNLEILILDNSVYPGVESISLSTCHDVKKQIVKAYTIMRLRQLAKYEFSPSKGNTASSLASKTAGSVYLADNYG